MQPQPCDRMCCRLAQDVVPNPETKKPRKAGLTYIAWHELVMCNVACRLLKVRCSKPSTSLSGLVLLQLQHVARLSPTVLP